MLVVEVENTELRELRDKMALVLTIFLKIKLVVVIFVEIVVN